METLDKAVALSIFQISIKGTRFPAQSKQCYSTMYLQDNNKTALATNGQLKESFYVPIQCSYGKNL